MKQIRQQIGTAKIRWADVKHSRLLKEESQQIFIKYDFDDPFTEVSISHTRETRSRKNKSVDYNLHQAYTGMLAISVAKKT